MKRKVSHDYLIFNGHNLIINNVPYLYGLVEEAVPRVDLTAPPMHTHEGGVCHGLPGGGGEHCV